MAKYYLCFECENEYGKKEVYPLLRASLDIIDMYTCYCKDKKDLFDKLPDGKVVVDTPMQKLSLPGVKGFINEHFDLNKNEYSFYIREDNGSNVRKGKKKIPILYSDNRDVVYINKGTEKDELLDILLKLKMSVSECNNANIRSLDKVDFEENKIKLDFFWELIKKIEKRNRTLIGMFEKNCGDYMPNRAYLLATSTSNLYVLSKEAKKNVMLRRELALDIKEVLKKLDDLKSVKTRLISKEESNERQKRKEEITKFSIRLIMENLSELLNEEKKYYNEKYSLDEEKESGKYVHEDDEANMENAITNDEVIAYNKTRTSKDINFNDTLDLMEKIESLKTQLLELNSSEEECNEVLRHASFVISLEEAKKRLSQIKSDKEKLVAKISELEYYFSELENGRASYSDAGFIIQKEDKKY